jgi:hypothetical protein
VTFIEYINYGTELPEFVSGTSKKRKAAESADGTDKDPTVQEVMHV